MVSFEIQVQISFALASSFSFLAGAVYPCFSNSFIQINSFALFPANVVKFFTWPMGQTILKVGRHIKTVFITLVNLAAG